jgi:thiol:disulfide interchange protein DsbD
MGACAKLLAIAFLSLVESAAGGPGVADAEERPAQGRHVAVSLIAETRSIVPGRSFHVALRQQIEPGWHTYWLNPGDSGLPTTIEWSLPQDFKAGPILWPLPERIAYGQSSTTDITTKFSFRWTSMCRRRFRWAPTS